jgi:peptidoglycan/LPS O-acetylase OafA/YrhL
MKIKYRKEINGLRAIAILAVIIYHANFTIFNKTFLSGGFLGVDIFFVISGYLLTSIILNEISTTNNFFFKNFYLRRVKRIVPALLFAMMCSLPFAYLILFMDPFIDFSKSLISAIFFVSNIYFNFTGNRYGEESTLLKPLLHTWSLSVEVQFYILLPIFIYIFIKFFKRQLISILIIGFLISILFAHYSSIYHPSFNFYQIFSRAFELLSGSLLAYFQLNNTTAIRESNKLFYQIFPKLGMSLIIFSFIFFSDKDLLPSFYSLIPLSGVCLFIWFSNKNEIVTKILQNKVFNFFGLISYSLYLFHYPIFAFSRVLHVFNEYYKFLFIILAIIISIFSYYFIERKFIDKEIISFKKPAIILFSFVIFLISFNIYIIKEDGLTTRLPKIFHTKLREQDLNIKFYQKENLPKVVLMGDSHAGALSFHLNEELKKNGFSLFRLSTKIYLKDFNYVDIKTKIIDKEFIVNNNKIDNFLNNNENLIIIFHQRWAVLILETYFEVNEGSENYDRTVEKYYNYLEPINIKTNSQNERLKFIKEALILQINNMINQGHKVILVYPVPEMVFEPHKLLYAKDFKKIIFNKKEYNPPVLTGSYEAFKERNKIIFEILDSNKSENIYRVYPHKHFCDNQIKNKCITNDTKNIFYYDNDHLSLSGSKFVVDDILKIIKNIK